MAKKAKVGKKAKVVRGSAARKAPARGKAAGPGTRRPAPRAKKAKADVPQLFRLNLEVGDLATASDFYGRLLAQDCRPQAGARIYVDCGPVTLQIVDVSASGRPHPAAKALYFTVRDVDAVHARAAALGALSKETVHGQRAGDVTVRPWGERSFYAQDPWSNPLCFVAEGTTYPG